MALRNPRPIKIDDFLGLQTFAAKQNLAHGWWFAGENVTVTTDGSAACLRSLGTYNQLGPLADASSTVLSIFDYDKSTGNIVLFDVEYLPGQILTFTTTGGANTPLLGTSAGRAKYLTVNDLAYRLQGAHDLFSFTNGTFVYDVGLAAPRIQPLIAYVPGGSGSFAVGVTVSYAYRRDATHGGHVGRPTASFNTLGPGGTRISIPVEGIGAAFADEIVVFMSLDGGSTRYLLIDIDGNPQTFPNVTGDILISIGDVYLDTNTEEPNFNYDPPSPSPYFMFKFRNRLCLCDFRESGTRPQVQYSAFESVPYGSPWESWPPSNAIYLPNKGDSARSGIETPIGALVLGEADSYLIRGTLTDKVASPAGIISATESIQPMAWALGTRSPYTLVTTPFGAMWLDQNKRIQMWDYSNFPQEIGIPIRNLLAEIQDTSDARDMAEAQWYQHGKDGGAFVLTASTAGTTNNKQFIIAVYRDPQDNELKFGAAVSTFPLQCLAIIQALGRSRLYGGSAGTIKEFYNLERQGEGYPAGQSHYFSMMLGNDMEYAYWHSFRFDASSIKGLKVTVSDPEVEDESAVIEVSQEGANGSWYGFVDQSGFRKVVTFTFNQNDTESRVIENFRFATVPKQRII